jgi:hypothetical protein
MKPETKARKQMDLIKTQAAQDAAHIVQANQQRDAAAMTMLETALERGRELRNPRASLFKDEKAGHIVGCHELHVFYLGEFSGALTKRLKLKEPNNYVKRLKSDFAALISACQISEGKIKVRQQADEKGRREATIKIEDFASWAKSIPGSIQFTGREPFMRAVQAARLLRTAAGYVPGRAPRRAGVRTPIKADAVVQMLDRQLHGRAGPPGLMGMVEWLARECQAMVPKQLQRELVAATTVWKETLERALNAAQATEVLALSGLKPTPARVTGGNGKQRAREQAELMEARV